MGSHWLVNAVHAHTCKLEDGRKSNKDAKMQCAYSDKVLSRVVMDSVLGGKTFSKTAIKNIRTDLGKYIHCAVDAKKARRIKQRTTS